MKSKKRVLGLYHTEGEYNGKHYDKFVIFIGYKFSEENAINSGIGFILTDKVKMNTESFMTMLDDSGFSDPKDFLNLLVEEVYYNQYRQAVSFLLDLDDYEE